MIIFVKKVCVTEFLFKQKWFTIYFLYLNILNLNSLNGIVCR